MNEPSYGDIAKNGLWANNPGLVQLLGLCPLLAVTTNAINAFGLALATILVLTLTNGVIALVRGYLRPEIRIAVFVVIIAGCVTAVELVIRAFFFELYQILGIFIPLIVTNCIVIGRAEAFASRHDARRALFDGLMMALGFAAVLVVLGSLRELVGHGTLLADAHLVFGEGARSWTVQWADYPGFLVAVLPPGAFFGLAALIAAKNALDRYLQTAATRPPAVAIADVPSTTNP